ncbi:hypothetical protein BT69DRAFT_1344754 [Atractiella rhizophila]|nr:hypothetical protein BT69DRAFT_1344754 [Atractiella rhizophila]
MHVRAKRCHTFFRLGVPGPNNPVNIQSFFLPFYKAMVKLSGGLWMWTHLLGSGLFGKVGLSTSWVTCLVPRRPQAIRGSAVVVFASLSVNF